MTGHIRFKSLPADCNAYRARAANGRKAADQSARLLAERRADKVHKRPAVLSFTVCHAFLEA
jgi:hypothetical protein